MRGQRLGVSGKSRRRAVAVKIARVALVSTMTVGFMPLWATSLSDGGRPSFVQEAEAALVAEATLAESRALWESRPRGARAERGSRLHGAKPDGGRVFTAGRLGTRGDLLGEGLAGGDELMRTALAGPERFGARMSSAANLQARRATLPVPPSIETAALRESAPQADVATDASAATTALGYAPAGPTVASRFDDVLRPTPGAGFVPPIGEKDHAWAATPLPASAFSKEEQTCLATGIYFEARGEEDQGQEAVAQVILNRVRAPSYPDTICDVVYQNKHMRNRCQFSFACDGIADRITNRRAYAKAQEIALAVTKGEIWLPEVGSATHYHATYVRPRWARAMERVDKIGLHIFYRTFGGGWN